MTRACPSRLEANQATMFSPGKRGRRGADGNDAVGTTPGTLLAPREVAVEATGASEGDGPTGTINVPQDGHAVAPYGSSA